MKLSIVSLFLIISTAFAIVVKKSSTSSKVTTTSTLTKTVMKTTSSGTTTVTSWSTIGGNIPDPQWLPAGDTKNLSPGSQKVRRDPAIKIEEITARGAVAASPAASTITKTVTATSTKTVPKATKRAVVSGYAACLNPANYVPKMAADAWSAVDGTCDCQAMTTSYVATASTAMECCNLCWKDTNCITSLWSPKDTSCVWITGQQCPSGQQSFNNLMYMNGSKYNDDKTISNGPCGISWFADV